MIKNSKIICGQHSDAANQIASSHNANDKIALTNSTNQFALNVPWIFVLARNCVTPWH
jgi:hypothetical protein